MSIAILLTVALVVAAAIKREYRRASACPRCGCGVECGERCDGCDEDGHLRERRLRLVGGREDER